jgi:hypothetical protein
MAQLRYLFAAQKRGEIPAGTAEKFVAETSKRKLKALPERVKVPGVVKLRRAKAKG